MSISFIIVNYQSDNYLAQCISSIKEKILDIDYEVIVVNNSNLKIELPSEVKALNMGKNVGYGSGCNAGAKLAQGEILCLLNPDTEIISKNVFNIIEKFDEDKNIGAIGTRLVTPEGKTQPWCAGKDFDIWQLFKNNLGWIDSKKIWESEKEILADWVSGAALFVKKEVFGKIGGFEEKFFMYAEDMDLCKRVRIAGYKILYCPQFNILHKGGKSRDNLFSQKMQFFKSTLLYLIKWFKN
jgi:GT2 family glycosyltransferase